MREKARRLFEDKREMVGSMEMWDWKEEIWLRREV
jgi:hypothetical protein